jgi:hypothetical protein
MSRRGTETRGYYDCAICVIPLGPSPSLHFFFNLSGSPRLCASARVIPFLLVPAITADEIQGCFPRLLLGC